MTETYACNVVIDLELGPDDKTLFHWVSKYKKEGRVGSGMTNEERDLAKLKREN